MKIELRILTDEEMADRDEESRWWWLEQAWNRWREYSCEERGGHWWWMEIDPDDGISFGCLHCPADIDTLYPDGHDLMCGDFEVHSGYTLNLNLGEVKVNGKACDSHLPWTGPVTVHVDITHYPGGPWGGEEWDSWVIVEPA